MTNNILDEAALKRVIDYTVKKGSAGHLIIFVAYLTVNRDSGFASPEEVKRRAEQLLSLNEVSKNINVDSTKVDEITKYINDKGEFPDSNYHEYSKVQRESGIKSIKDFYLVDQLPCLFGNSLKQENVKSKEEVGSYIDPNSLIFEKVRDHVIKQSEKEIGVPIDLAARSEDIVKVITSTRHFEFLIKVASFKIFTDEYEISEGLEKAPSLSKAILDKIKEVVELFLSNTEQASKKLDSEVCVNMLETLIEYQSAKDKRDNQGKNIEPGSVMNNFRDILISIASFIMVHKFSMLFSNSKNGNSFRKNMPLIVKLEQDIELKQQKRLGKQESLAKMFLDLYNAIKFEGGDINYNNIEAHKNLTTYNFEAQLENQLENIKKDLENRPDKDELMTNLTFLGEYVTKEVQGKPSYNNKGYYEGLLIQAGVISKIHINNMGEIKWENIREFSDAGKGALLTSIFNRFSDPFQKEEREVIIYTLNCIFPKGDKNSSKDDTCLQALRYFITYLALHKARDDIKTNFLIENCEKLEAVNKEYQEYLEQKRKSNSHFIELPNNINTDKSLMTQEVNEGELFEKFLKIRLLFLKTSIKEPGLKQYIETFEGNLKG